MQQHAVPNPRHMDDLLLDKLSSAFNKDTYEVLLHDVAKIASEHDPVDLAFAAPHLPASARHVVYENLPDLDSKISFVLTTGANTRLAVFRHAADADLIELIEHMPPDEGAFLLDDMPERRLRRLLDNLSIKRANLIRDLLKHSQYSAGRLMTNEFFAFYAQTTVGEAAEFIRENPGIEMTRRVFVVNEDRKAVGFVPSRNLIVNGRDIPLRQVMQPIQHSVTPDASRQEVVDLVERYKIPALPVMDEEGRLVGVVTYEDVVEVMEDIADETIAHMAGTAEDISEDDPIFMRLLWRAPWLLVTLCAGLVTATGLNHFQDYPWFAFVPFFLPLITGMSGNVGIQCSTVLVRAMATGELSAGMRKEAIRQELLIGLSTGLLFGVVCGLVVYALNASGMHRTGADALEVGLIVSSGVLGACLLATCLGTFSPMIFFRLGVDPAVAAGPIVTAFNDVVSALMYCVIAHFVSVLLH
jgi:magnesium transporter